MNNEEKIADIVAMLDDFVTTGGGHMNIRIEDPEHVGQVKVDTYRSNDCSVNPMACSVPTLQDCIDFDPDDDDEL